MLTSVLPFLAVATPGIVIAGVVSNTATITAPDNVFEANASNNTAEDSDTRYAVIVTGPDNVSDVNGYAGADGALNVFGGDTIDGVEASPANAVLSLPASSSLPAGITIDLDTGLVSVAPGTAEGTFNFDYQICELAFPDNCATETVTVGVVAPVGTLSGFVYEDEDGDRVLEDSERRLTGWTVQVLDGDTIVGTAITGPDGGYEVDGLNPNANYTIVFRHPDTGVVYEQITGVVLSDNTTLPDQNLPIDPSGVIYDAVTRLPVEGVVATLVDRNGNELPEECFLDPSQRSQVTSATGEYRFDVVVGASAACPEGSTDYTIAITPPAGYSFVSTILAPQTGPLDPTGRGSPFLVDVPATAPTSSDPVYYLSFSLAAGDPDVVHNHIPLDPFLSRDGLIVTKTSTRRTASTGDLIPYEITVRNEEPYRRADVDVIDILPTGLSYVQGSALVNGVASEPERANGNRELIWRDQIIPANSTVRYNLTVVVGAGVTEGQAVNIGLAENDAGTAISNRGSATVSIVPSTLFDCSELIGQVFVDRDGDGYQDDGEPGVPGVRLATVKGELITTDQYGRYHIACAAVPDARIGSNYVLKLDEATLPQGWVMTSDNPRSIRLTRGKMGELNFGVTPADSAMISIDARAFGPDGQLLPSAMARFKELTNREEAPLIVTATYQISAGEAPGQVGARIEAIRATLKQIFEQSWTAHTPAIQVDASVASAARGEE